MKNYLIVFILLIFGNKQFLFAQNEVEPKVTLNSSLKNIVFSEKPVPLVKIEKVDKNKGSFLIKYQTQNYNKNSSNQFSYLNLSNIDSLYIGNSNHVFLPDQNRMAMSSKNKDIAPVGSKVTNVTYLLKINDDGDSSSFYCGDYEIYISSDPNDLIDNTYPQDDLVYDNLGNRTDGGYDDDPEDDSDIWLGWRSTSFFNGEDPNQYWGIEVWDTIAGDSGKIDYMYLKVFWETPELTLTSPNGGESWQQGSTHTITWNDNISENVKIELYKNGAFNSTISSSTTSDGSYSWTVPSNQTVGSDYKIKITSVNNSSLNDYSDNNFTISSTPPNEITITRPNGGESWTKGTYWYVYWNDNISENVKIELYKGSSSYRTITSSTASDGSYTWTIPNDVVDGSDYRIRITSISNSSVYDLSDSYFTIKSGVTVTSPNSGENWQTNSSHNITWNDELSENVKIELYKGSSSYRTITSSTSSDGSYSWTIPSDIPAGTDYRIKISGTSNTGIYDYSDGYFTIRAADNITLTSPNGGESWQEGTTHKITWNDNISENVKIELYKNGSFNSTISSSTTSDGSYSWTVPSNQTVGSDYKVKITSVNSSSLNDYSNSNFTISAADNITLTSPNGGESWQQGSTHTITWNDNISENVKIELYNNGSFNSTISSSTTSDGSYSWTVPSNQTVGSDYKVKITSVNSSSLNDYSNSNFTISAADNITLTSPNGGESWQEGTTHTITWNDNISENVKIELYKNGSFNSTISDSTTNDGSYSWSIPRNQTVGSDYKIKITSVNNSSLNDYSDNNFTISVADSITVTAPNGGENWQQGTTHTITWNDNISENVKIELYKNGSFNSTISDSTTNDGSYSWSIPRNQTVGSDYKIKITSVNNMIRNNYSDNNFTISAADNITLTSPNGGENWQQGSTHTITWNDNISENVKIELYKNGSFNRTIENSTSSDGSYNWSIPSNQTLGTDYKIRISSVNNSNLYDESDSFSVTGSLIILSKSSISFGEVQQNKTKEKELKIVNPGTSDLKISNIQISNSVFAVSNKTFTINPGDSISIYIYFSPIGIQNYSGTLLIINNSIDSIKNILLEGSGFFYSNNIVLNESVSFNDFKNTTSYKLIGLPGEVNILLEEILNGSAGKENDWRAFYDPGSGNLKEYDGTFRFNRGNGYWVLSKNKISLNKNINTVELKADNTCSIALHPEWNIITNPFTKEISWTDIRKVNKLGSEAKIYYYENGGYITPLKVEAYKGYYFFNNPIYNLDSLKIPYISSNTVPKKSWIEENTKEIGIKLVEGNKEIGKVFVGYLEEGKEGLDRYDEYSPPGEFERKSIKIRNDKLETEYKYLRKDYRKEIGGGQKYEIDIKIDPDQKMKLRAIVGKEYGDYKFYLVDERLKNIYDLTREDEIEISTNHKFNQYEFLVGTEEYVKTRTENLVPKEIELYQNYPNPFNPRTIIRFSLPEESRVTLLVYNLLGELVKTLINNQVYRAGYHEVVWDASIETSGIYFYKLNIGNYVLVKKMILMK